MTIPFHVLGMAVSVSVHVASFDCSGAPITDARACSHIFLCPLFMTVLRTLMRICSSSTDQKAWTMAHRISRQAEPQPGEPRRYSAHVAKWAREEVLEVSNNDFRKAWLP